jgi:hypothetical protein
METAEEWIVSTLKQFGKYRLLEEVKETSEDIVEEAKEKLVREVETIVIQREPLDAIDKQRAEKRWKQSIGYYQLNPHKFTFGLKDLKKKKLKRF